MGERQMIIVEQQPIFRQLKIPDTAEKIWSGKGWFGPVNLSCLPDRMLCKKNLISPSLSAEAHVLGLPLTNKRTSWREGEHTQYPQE